MIDRLVENVGRFMLDISNHLPPPLARLSGPEDPSLLERLVNLFRLPYPLGSLLLALARGSPSYYLGQYLDTGNPHIAADPNGFLGDMLYVVMPFYAFLAVRYMRVRIVQVEPKLALLSPDGEESSIRRSGG